MTIQVKEKKCKNQVKSCAVNVIRLDKILTFHYIDAFVLLPRSAIPHPRTQSLLLAFAFMICGQFFPMALLARWHVLFQKKCVSDGEGRSPTQGLMNGRRIESAEREAFRSLHERAFSCPFALHLKIFILRQSSNRYLLEYCSFATSTVFIGVAAERQ